MEQLLGELQRDALSVYDAFTVGESVFIDVPKTLRYTDERHAVLNTVFAFDHTSCDNFFGIKQFVKKFSLRQLKRCFTRWQSGLYGKSWNTLFFENHDQARVVGRYVSDTVARKEGAKLIATLLLTNCGTPFIYQGQEIGTTSIRMTDIERYQDVESHNSFKTMSKIFGKKGAMWRVAYCSRDNARTPMQWNGGKNAGFSDGDSTWLPVNPNYTDINVERDLADEDGVIEYYKMLIEMRKANKEFVYGTFQDLMPKHGKIFAYLREFEGKKLLVVLNFSEKNTKFKLPKGDFADFELLTSNYQDSATKPADTVLRPYEATVYKGYFPKTPCI
jgi:glycosidase